MPDLTALQLSASSPEVGHTCPFCHNEMKAGEVVVTCTVDEAIHHADCWRDNSNRCTTFGCTGRGAIVATVAPADVASTIEFVNTPLPPPYTPGPVIDINIPIAPPMPPPPSARPALNLRTVALGVVGVVVALALLFQLFGGDDSPPPPPTATLSVVGPTQTAAAITRAAFDNAATADAAIQATALSDADGDGLPFNAESLAGTDADNADSDGDGLEDGQEIDSYYDTDPLEPDTDHDGLTDYQEIETFRTNPIEADSDGDGITDGVEVLRGLDPRQATEPTSQATRRPTPRPAPQPTPPSLVTGLRLIDANSDRAIGSLTDGDTISLQRTGSALSIEALVNSSSVGSVVFYLDGRLFCMNNADRCFENAPPYAMSGDQGGDYYNNWDWSRLSRGNHTVDVVTCSGANATGDCREALTVTFTIAR